MRTERPTEVLAGRYALGEELGRGGTGVVWSATDSVLERTVAVKVLRPALADDPAFRERLARHAGAAAEVSGPGLARLLDTGEERGIAFIVREHIPGESLRARLEREGRLEPAEAIRAVLQVLDGLATIHAAGVLHLDVKPENVIGDGSGEVRLTDLGIGAAVTAAYGPRRACSVLAMATPAPEQRAGHQPDARTDVFLAGALLFELLAGSPPHGERSIRALVADAPSELEVAVGRALAPEPDERFADAEAFAAALRPVLEEADPRRPHHAEEAHGGLRSWLVVPGAVVVSAAVAVAAGLWLGRLEIGGPLGVRARETTPTPAPSATPTVGVLPLAGVAAHDPFGDGAEHDASAPLAIDGDPATAWRSENYLDPTMNNKSGVGLLFDLGETRTVTGFRLSVPHPGFTFGLAVGDDADALASSIVATFSAERSMRATIEPTQGRYVLFWATSVVDAGDGNRAEVAEFQVIGR